MNILLAQIVLGGRNEDVESWMNILVVVVLAAFWALGGIIKARKQGAQNRQKEPLTRKPARRPPAQSRTLREQLLKEPHHPAAPTGYRPARPGIEQARTKLAEWRAAAQKLAAEAEQAFRVQIAEPATQTHKPAMRPKRPHQPPEIPQPAAKLSVAPEAQPAPDLLETPPEEYLAELLADYADPDELRRAILHYEILGRPLSLRDAGESPIGL